MATEDTVTVSLLPCLTYLTSGFITVKQIQINVCCCVCLLLQQWLHVTVGLNLVGEQG